MLVLKLAILAIIFLAFFYLSIRLTKRGLSRRYEPHAKTPWNSLNEGEDPTL
jgi:hypothetical protein